MTSAPIVILSRALDQAGDALAAVHADDLDKPTPCADWNVRDLAAHLASGPARFLQMARGEEVDWSATPQSRTAPGRRRSAPVPTT